MLCCSGERQTSAVDILRSKPQPCSRHKRVIRFVCRTCPHESLLCQQCILDHQDHDWIPIQNYLTQDVIKLFQSGQSRSGKAVQNFVDKVVSQLIDYQQRIQKKLKQVIASIMISLQKLKAKFPVHGGYHISGTSIDQKNIRQIDRILSYEKYIFDTRRLEKTFDDIIFASQTNIQDNLQKMKVTLSDKDWDLLEQTDVVKIETDFLAIYRKLPPNRNFFFSLTQKNVGIKLENGRLSAVYNRQIPRSPVALLDKSFRDQLHSVGFKITKMKTHAFLFDMSRVYIGMCNPELAESFGYLDFAKPSKGAYLISSTGRCYHSKLPQYHDTSLAFSFRGGDIVSLDLNIQNGVLIFEKKTGKLPVWKKLAMPLGLQPKFISELKPCVMFQGEVGAQITILNQTQMQLQVDGKVVYPYIKL